MSASYNAIEAIHADGWSLGYEDAIRDVADDIGVTLHPKRRPEVGDLIAAMRAAITGFAEWQDAQP